MHFFPAPEYSVWCEANSTLYGPGGVEYVVDCCDHFDFCNRNLTPSFPSRGGPYSRLPRTRYNFLATFASFQGRCREKLATFPNRGNLSHALVKKIFSLSFESRTKLLGFCADCNLSAFRLRNSCLAAGFCKLTIFGNARNFSFFSFFTS